MKMDKQAICLFIHQGDYSTYTVIDVYTHEPTEEDMHAYMNDMNSRSRAKFHWYLCDCLGTDAERGKCPHPRGRPGAHWACAGQGYLRVETRDVKN